MHNPQLQRAYLLQSQGRHEMAEKEFRQYLATDPDNGSVHAALAVSLMNLTRRDEAEHEVRQAVGLDPDNAFVHYAMGVVLADRNRHAGAVEALHEAVRLEPTDSDYHGMLALVEIDRERWKEALEAAETGLRFNPEDANCNNARAVALVKLGRRAEAGMTLDASLQRDPSNSQTHANKGWALLEAGKRQEAMKHFQESLRLDPTNDWARGGLVEAIKAGNLLYAGMLKYILWMAKLSERGRWGLILGGYFGNRLLGSVADSNPMLAPFILPLRVLYIAFVILTWLAVPLFNLMLFLYPLGRHALDADQRNQARVAGSLIGLALAAVAAGFLLGNARYIFLGLVLGLLALPALAIFSCSPGWPRWTMLGITLVLALIGLVPVVLMLVQNPPAGSPEAERGFAFLGTFLVGALLSQFAANWLMTQRPTR
jgi:Flp pilus assembly protein TadD